MLVQGGRPHSATVVRLWWRSAPAPATIMGGAGSRGHSPSISWRYGTVAATRTHIAQEEWEAKLATLHHETGPQRLEEKDGTGHVLKLFIDRSNALPQPAISYPIFMS